MNIDVWEVIHAASTKPFGYMPFYPGVGVGGHCIPVDPFYLSWKAKEYDFYVNFIELAARINDNRPYYAASRIGDILAGSGKLVKDSRLLLLGLSFKKDIGDVRNSPALRVAELLAERGATIAYSDRLVPEARIRGRTVRSIEPDQASLGEYDATIILVDHSYYDLEKVVRHSKLIIDTRDATRPLGPQPKVVRL
jgi:UDP-N-acetyl-D-glucosamine dehydrogenase